MNRLALVILIPLAACDGAQPPVEGPGIHDGGCDIDGIGAFEIAAPRPGLHYDKSLDVVINESELLWSFTVRVIDDHGTAIAPISDVEIAQPADAGSWWSLDKYHFELAASTHYTASVAVCPDRIQTVEFFTSPD